MREDQTEDFAQLLIEAYRRGYHQGVKEANAKIKEILHEEGFWDE